MGNIYRRFDSGGKKSVKKAWKIFKANLDTGFRTSDGKIVLKRKKRKAFLKK